MAFSQGTINTSLLDSAIVQLSSAQLSVSCNVFVCAYVRACVVVLNELKDRISNQNAYQLVDIDVPSVINTHLRYMSSKNIKIPLDMEHLPCLYWLPKLHKTPYGCRFIAASNKCTTKPLSGLLASCLTTIVLHFKEYCNGIFKNTGINCFWIVNNSQQVLSSILSINNESKAKHWYF